MSWNYRIIGLDNGSYSLREVYYDQEGKIESISSRNHFFLAESINSLVNEIRLVSAGLVGKRQLSEDQIPFDLGTDTRVPSFTPESTGETTTCLICGEPADKTCTECLETWNKLKDPSGEIRSVVFWAHGRQMIGICHYPWPLVEGRELYTPVELRGRSRMALFELLSLSSDSLKSTPMIL